jgi:hypothetical protein
MRQGIKICRLTPEQFGLMRPADFFLYLDACNEQLNDEFKRHAELIRHQTALLFNIQIAKEDRLTDQQLWPFEWDEQTAPEETSLPDEAILAHNARLAAML